MIKAINGWRAVFALMIVLFHVGVTGLEEMTWAGVTFFLMASGFLLSMKHPMDELDRESYLAFVKRHAVKLFPLHWLSLLMWIAVMALLGTLVVKPLALTLNVTLLHSWSLSHSVYFSYNKFSWFLSTLLFCYLCYPLLARWFMPLPLRVKLYFIGLLAVIAIIILSGTDDYGRTALYVFPPMRLIDFIIGMTLGDICKSLSGTRVLGRGPNGTDAELASVALLSLGVMLFRTCQWLLPWSDAILWWLPVGFLLVTCLLYDKREGLIGKLLSSRPLQWLGDISFELFILQGIAALVFNYLVAPALGHLGLGHPSPFDTAASTDVWSVDPYSMICWFILPIDIVLAWAVNRLFTRPLKKLFFAF